MFVGTERYRAAGVLVFLVIVMLAGCSLDPQKGKVKYLNSGKSYLKAGKYREASIQFRNPIKLDPRFAEAYYQLAQADLSLKEWNAALGSLQKTVELDPQRVDAHLDIGRLYWAAREYQKAEDEVSRIHQDNPGTSDISNTGGYQILAAAEIGRKDLVDARQAYSKLTELRPDDPSVFTNL